MLKSRPKASSTATTSLASMLSHAMDMTKARIPRISCRDQCGGLLGLRRRANTTDRGIPAETRMEEGGEEEKEMTRAES